MPRATSTRRGDSQPASGSVQGRSRKSGHDPRGSIWKRIGSDVRTDPGRTPHSRPAGLTPNVAHGGRPSRVLLSRHARLAGRTVKMGAVGRLSWALGPLGGNV